MLFAQTLFDCEVIKTFASGGLREQLMSCAERCVCLEVMAAALVKLRVFT